MLLSYFVSLPRLYAMMTHAPGENWTSFVFVSFITGALWFDLAWFREQFCIVICPYGRSNPRSSTAFARRRLRHETRRTAREARLRGAGACVDCLRCVHVCPTGIDIRQGLQMECIGCTACIDACDSVMTKIKRPTASSATTRGMVLREAHSLAASADAALHRPGAPRRAALTAATSTLKSAAVGLTRVTGIPYLVEDGVVRNQFLVRLLNKRNAPVTFQIQVAGGPPSLHWTGAEGGVRVAPLGEEIRTLVLTLPRSDLQEELPLRFRISFSGGTIIEKPATFLGPLRP